MNFSWTGFILEFFQEMRRARVKPNASSFNTLLGFFRHEVSRVCSWILVSWAVILEDMSIYIYIHNLLRGIGVIVSIGVT